MKINFEMLRTILKNVAERNYLNLNDSSFPTEGITATVIREYFLKCKTPPSNHGTLVQIIDGLMKASRVLSIGVALDKLEEIQNKFNDIIQIDRVPFDFESYDFDKGCRPVPTNFRKSLGTLVTTGFEYTDSPLVKSNIICGYSLARTLVALTEENVVNINPDLSMRLHEDYLSRTSPLWDNILIQIKAANESPIAQKLASKAVKHYEEEEDKKAASTHNSRRLSFGN